MDRSGFPAGWMDTVTKSTKYYKDRITHMKQICFIISLCMVSATGAFSADVDPYAGIKNSESLEGITHYGLQIEEIKKSYKKEDAVLEIVYSKTLSDDNMDAYVQQFYDELLHQIEKWLYENKLPAAKMKIVISNCKFCKIGYCKKKKVKEISLVSYKNEKKFKQVSFNHTEIIDRHKYVELAQSAVVDLLER